MTIIDERLQLLDRLTLKHGSHPDFEQGACVMEAVAWIAGEPHSDHPACASQVITAFLIRWNDSLRSDEERDRLLKPLIPLIVGTRTTRRDETTRAWMAVDWLVREQAPAWLRLADLAEHARELENLAALTGPDQATIARPTINEARKASAAAWDAAGGAAGAVAWDAARDAARDAAGDVAGAVAGAAAWDVAWAAAWTAARDAARDALEPTVQLLQTSAVLLVQRMCEVGRK